jgi:hypothetical protein
MWADIKRFCWAIFSDWVAIVSGVGSVVFLLLGFTNPHLASPQVWFGLAPFAFLTAAFRVWRKERQLLRSGHLEISFQENERQFEERKYRNISWATTTLSVCVENLGELALHNCQLYFDGISSEDGNLPKAVALCPAPFDLNGSESRFVEIVSFEERKHATMGALHVPLRIDRTLGNRTFDAAEEHRITLRATAAECAPCVRHFRFWVTQDFRIKMERVGRLRGRTDAVRLRVRVE